MKVKYILIFLILCVFKTNAQLILKYKNLSVYYYKSDVHNLNSVLYYQTNTHSKFKTNLKDSKTEFENRLAKQIIKYLDINFSQDLNKTKDKRQVSVDFVINKNGKITNLEMYSKQKHLISNVYNAINKLGNFTISSKNVKYSLSVNFDIKSITNTINYQANVYYTKISCDDCDGQPIQAIPFSVAKIIPRFKNQKIQTKKEFDRKIQLFITKNYNSSACLFLDSGKYKIYIQFVINKNGLTKNIKVRAPNKTLEKEIINSIKKLPQFIPGKQRNKPVEIRYNTTINFNVEE